MFSIFRKIMEKYFNIVVRKIVNGRFYGCLLFVLCSG